MRCSRRFETKTAGFPIERYTVKKLNPMGTLDYPGEGGESLSRAFGGTVDLLMFTARLDSVRSRWCGGRMAV
jgi:hypothetical protein